VGRPPAGEARVREWVGNGVERLVRRALVGRLEGEPPAALLERALPLFLRLYGGNVARRSRLYPGALAALDALRARGCRLGCVTNKARRFTLPLLRALDLAPRFGVVVAGDDLGRKKPVQAGGINSLVLYQDLEE